MRRMIIVPLAAALVLAAAAPVAAGPNSSNTSGSGRTVQGEWFSGETYGFVYLFDESGGTYGEVYEETGQYVECATGPDGEAYGFQGTRMQGSATDLAITIDSKLTTGSAAGAFDIAIETVDECAGTSDVAFETVDAAVDVSGAGPVSTFRNSGSFKIPGEYNAHSRYRGKERPAEGQIDLGARGIREFGWSMMSTFSWSDHSNG